jgi:signal peptidase II
MSSHPLKWARALIVFMVLILNVGCDQATKAWVRQAVDFNERISLMETPLNFQLTLTKVQNHGAFLGLGGQWSEGLRDVLFTGLPVLFLLAALVYVLVNANLRPFLTLSYCLFIGGGVGNVYDRFTLGSVTDFLHLRFLNLQTGIFNVADMSIMAGMFGLLATQLFFPNAEKPKSDLESDPATKVAAS